MTTATLLIHRDDVSRPLTWLAASVTAALPVACSVYPQKWGPPHSHDPILLQNQQRKSLQKRFKASRSLRRETHSRLQSTGISLLGWSGSDKGHLGAAEWHSESGRCLSTWKTAFKISDSKKSCRAEVCLSKTFPGGVSLSLFVSTVATSVHVQFWVRFLVSSCDISSQKVSSLCQVSACTQTPEQIPCFNPNAPVSS